MGVPLPAGAVAQLAVAQRELRKAADGLRVNASWEKPEKMHVTLKFLGDVAEPRLDDLSLALDEVASRQRAFAFELEGVGGFPAGKSPQIVYAAVEVAEILLYASTIERSGSVHRVLSRHALIRDIRTDP